MMRLANETDFQLLREYEQSGSEAAFAELSRRHWATTVQAAMRITRGRADAEDVAQACLTELAIRPGVVKSSVPGWLRSNAVHLALNLMRGERRRRKRELSVGSRPAPDKLDVESAEIASEALAQLPGDLRQLVELHYLEGMDQETLARQFGLNQSTVSRRLARGIKRLREVLGASIQRRGMRADRVRPTMDLKRCVATQSIAPESYGRPMLV